MQNAMKRRLWECGNRRTFAIDKHFKRSKDMKQVMRLFFAAAVLVGLTACNSNDDFGTQAIEIPGVTIDGDVDCCSAEEALQVYNFLQTVKIIPEL